MILKHNSEGSVSFRYFWGTSLHGTGKTVGIVKEQWHVPASLLRCCEVPIHSFVVCSLLLYKEVCDHSSECVMQLLMYLLFCSHYFSLWAIKAKRRKYFYTIFYLWSITTVHSNSKASKPLWPLRKDWFGSKILSLFSVSTTTVLQAAYFVHTSIFSPSLCVSSMFPYISVVPGVTY